MSSGCSRLALSFSLKHSVHEWILRQLGENVPFPRAVLWAPSFLPPLWEGCWWEPLPGQTIPCSVPINPSLPSHLNCPSYPEIWPNQLYSRKQVDRIWGYWLWAMTLWQPSCLPLFWPNLHPGRELSLNGSATSHQSSLVYVLSFHALKAPALSALVPTLYYLCCLLRVRAQRESPSHPQNGLCSRRVLVAEGIFLGLIDNFIEWLLGTSTVAKHSQRDMSESSVS